MAGAHCARAVVSFVLSEALEEDVNTELEDELRLQGASREQYTQVAAISAREKQQRSLPMLFQPFQPRLMRVEKVEQPNLPKTVFCQ